MAFLRQKNIAHKAKIAQMCSLNRGIADEIFYISLKLN